MKETAPAKAIGCTIDGCQEAKLQILAQPPTRMYGNDRPPPSISPAGNLFERTVRLAVAAYLVFLCWWIVSTFSASLLLPWFSSSDETVIAAEVIRFSNLDFHQHFYDMPGTPLMLLGAIQWGLFYWWSLLVQGFHGGINLFSFQHLQQLLLLLRADNMLFFLLSGLLLFRLVSGMSNYYAGAAAATLLLMNPAYALTAGFLRVEPLAMCLMLAGILVLTESPWKSGCFWAGLLGGAAAACRLHSIAATLPILMLILFSQTWGRQTDYSPRSRRIGIALGGALFVAAALLFYFFGLVPSSLKRDYPLAFALVTKASLLICFLVAVVVVLYLCPRSRPMVVTTMTPRFFSLLGGVVIGFLLGTPTVFTQYAALLRSLDFYSGPGYKDVATAHLPLWGKVTSYLAFYSKAIAPDNVAILLLVLGACSILLLAQWRFLWPYLIVGLSFFFSRPIDLRRAEHHVALWIPFYATLSAVPIAAVCGALGARGKIWRYSIAPAAIVALLFLRADLKKGPLALASNVTGHLERLQNIEHSRAWIQANTAKDSSFWIAFYCFGPEVFYSWFHDTGLQVPTQVSDGREYLTWWGKQSELKGQSGFACLTPTDVGYMKAFNTMQPGEGIDPLHDSRFHVIQSFGNGPNEIDLVQFDLANAEDARPAGFTFSMHSALRLESLTRSFEKASIRGNSPFVVTTGPELWSFAATIPIIVSRTVGSQVWLHVRGRVLKGRIGIGIQDRKTGLVQGEEFLSPTSNTKDIYISLPSSGQADDLFIQNARADTRSEIALVETEALARAHRADPVARLEEIQLADEQASIVRQRQVLITTAPQPGSFAAVVPIHGSIARGLVLKIRARVVQGKMEFGILSQDGKSVRWAQYYDKSQNPIEVFLPLEPADGSSKLLIRNAAPNKTVSITELDSIETWKLE